MDALPLYILNIQVKEADIRGKGIRPPNPRRAYGFPGEHLRAGKRGLDETGETERDSSRMSPCYHSMVNNVMGIAHRMPLGSITASTLSSSPVKDQNETNPLPMRVPATSRFAKRKLRGCPSGIADRICYMQRRSGARGGIRRSKIFLSMGLGATRPRLLTVDRNETKEAHVLRMLVA